MDTMNILNGIILVAYLLLRQIFAEVKLDDEHLELYPYCGKLFGYQSLVDNDAKSRVVNSIESKTQYPWVVFHKSFWKLATRHGILPAKNRLCSGTVIGER